MTIYGDGSQTRSFCYVSDLIDGSASLARRNTFRQHRQSGRMDDPRVCPRDTFGHRRGSVLFHPPTGRPQRRRPDITREGTPRLEPKIKLRHGLEKSSNTSSRASFGLLPASSGANVPLDSCAAGYHPVHRATYFLQTILVERCLPSFVLHPCFQLNLFVSRFTTLPVNWFCVVPPGMS